MHLLRIYMLVLGMVEVRLTLIYLALRPTGACLARDIDHFSVSKWRNGKTKRELD